MIPRTDHSAYPDRCAATMLPGRIPLRRLPILLPLALIGLAAPAAGHTRLEATAPAAGDTVAGVREVRLRFTLPTEASMTWAAVLAGGDTVTAGPLRAVAGSGDREFVLSFAGDLPPGGYRVVWRTAGADGHVVRGAFEFVVRAADAEAPADTVPPPVAPGPMDHGEEQFGGSPLGTVIRWAWFLGLLGMIGAPAFYAGVLDRMRRRGLHEQVTARAAYGAWHVAAGAAALSLLSMVLRLWSHSAEMYGPAEALEGSRLAALLQTTTWGTAWTLQAVATAGFFLGLMVVRAPHGRGAGWTGAGAAAVLLAAVPALSGHAAAVPEATGAAIVLDVLHVLGAGVWLGTLAVLFAAGVPAALSPADGGSPLALADLVNTFSPVALAGAGVAGLTGVGSALFHLGAPSDLWATGYGRTLALKLLLLAGVAAAGAYNWRGVRPALADTGGAGRLRRSVAVELTLGALVVLVTAVLVALPTP